MGMFSLFSSKNTDNNGVVNYCLDLDKDFYISIVENSNSMMLYFTKGKGWIGANKTFFQIMGFMGIQEFREQNDSVRDMFVSESEEIFTESDKSWLEYIRRHKPQGYRVSIKDKSGNLLVIDAKCHVFSKDEDFYILELVDVTDLSNAKLKMKEVEKLKTKFLANIGHEFRTPMNAILGFVDLLDHTKLDASQHEYLNMINNSSKSLMNNIETLLDLSQLQGGRLIVDSSEMNLLVDMEALAYNIFLAGAEKGIKVTTFIDPKLPKEMKGDAKKIKQIMYAITHNALKFTPSGGKVGIEIKLLKLNKEGECSVGFSVKDNGSGISNEQIALINEPFTSTNQADERLGVGLSLSHGLVEILGSELKIQNLDQEGTYVNFVLDFKANNIQNFQVIPKKKVKVLLLEQKKIDEANLLTVYLRSFSVDVVKSNILDTTLYDGVDAVYIVANQKDATWMADLGTYAKKAPIVLLLENGEKLQTQITHLIDDVIMKPILPSVVAKHLYVLNKLEDKSQNEVLNIKDKVNALVVEDNLINQKLIKIILEGYNLDVSTASDGIEAVEMCKTNKYDIVFMDIDMPHMNGIAATKEIKDALIPNGKTPIVALTAMAMEGDKEMLLREGLDDYLSKPLTRNKLETILDRYLKK